jgi:hypothetical protein
MEMEEQRYLDHLRMMRERMDVFLHRPFGHRFAERLCIRLAELRALFQDRSDVLGKLELCESFFVMFASAHHEAPKQASIDTCPKVSCMVVKRPRSHHLLGHVEGVGPALVRTDLV